MRALALCLLLTGCAHTEVQFLAGPRVSEGDTEIAATISVLRKVGNHGRCGWVHNSEVFHGRPLNDDDELTFDHLACGWRWER